VYSLNRSGSKTLSNITPFEAWHKKKPSVGHMRVFGADAYVHIPDQLRKKLDAKATKGIFMGYSTTSKAYRIWDNQSRKITESRDVLFDEDSMLEIVCEQERQEADGLTHDMVILTIQTSASSSPTPAVIPPSPESLTTPLANQPPPIVDSGNIDTGEEEETEDVTNMDDDTLTSWDAITLTFPIPIIPRSMEQIPLQLGTNLLPVVVANQSQAASEAVGAQQLAGATKAVGANAPDEDTNAVGAQDTSVVAQQAYQGRQHHHPTATATGHTLQLKCPRPQANQLSPRQSPKPNSNQSGRNGTQQWRRSTTH
jgi:hypothetical protein